jgi:hypothetical protein
VYYAPRVRRFGLLLRACGGLGDFCIQSHFYSSTSYGCRWRETLTVCELVTCIGVEMSGRAFLLSGRKLLILKNLHRCLQLPAAVEVCAGPVAACGGRRLENKPPIGGLTPYASLPSIETGVQDRTVRLRGFSAHGCILGGGFECFKGFE